MKQQNGTKHSSHQGLDLSLGNIYFILFRHKWKIMVSTTVGLIAAVVAYVSTKPSYVSEARLFIQYIETDAPVSFDNSTRVNQLNRKSDSVISNELQILTSNDLVEDLVKNLGPSTIIPEPEDPAAKPRHSSMAVSTIHKGLAVEVPKRTTTISLRFQNGNAEIVQPVLNELINVYLQRHRESYKTSGALDDFLTQQTDQLRAKLAQTEEELQAAKSKVGVISLEETRAYQNQQLARLKQDILSAEAELAGNQAFLDQLPKPENSKVDDTQTAATIDTTTIENYQRLRERLNLLSGREIQLLSQYTAETPQVKSVQSQILEIRSKIREIEEANPYFTQITASSSVASAANGVGNTAQNLRNQNIALTTRVKILREQLVQLQKEITQVNQAEININELMRRRQVDESNYKTFMTRLESERIANQFDVNKASGIDIVQRPSPPFKAKSKATIVAGALLGGGLALGLAWAFLIEFYLDTSLKRSVEVERTLGVPHFLSIPNSEKANKSSQSKKGNKKPLLMAAAEKSGEYSPKSTTLKAAAKAEPEKYGPQIEDSKPPQTAWEQDPALLPYYEALRDRVIGFFESRGLAHNPKLIGLTGLGEQPGVSTVAYGLASCLSKTGEGNVLLVDMTLGHESAQQFYNGKEICDLDHALESQKSAKTSGNDHLYVAAEGSNGYKIPKILPNRFNHLVPKLKASDFDYIIFDMPEISPISATPRLSRFMDAMLVVIEAEKTSKEVAKKALELLESNNDNVGTVLNKTNQYVPRFLQQDFQGLS